MDGRGSDIDAVNFTLLGKHVIFDFILQHLQRGRFCINFQTLVELVNVDFSFELG